MDHGFYVAPIVIFVSLYILIRSIKASKQNNENKVNWAEIWKKYSNWFKWLPVSLCLFTTILLLLEIISLSKLQGGALAQWQIGVGFIFSFFVIPTIIMVSLSIVFYFKFEVDRNNFSLKAIMNPYLICAVLSLLLPILLLSNVSYFIRY